MGLWEKIEAKLEYYRLEQRYAKRAKRNTFVSDAQYIDGEYVYGPASPTSFKSTTTTSSRTSRKGAIAIVRELNRR